MSARTERYGRRPSPVFVALALAVVVGIIVVFSFSGGSGPTGPQTGPVEVSGAALPTWSGEGSDPAVGMEAPRVGGIDFAEAPVRIEPGTRPMAIVFLAHWCPHCRREVPMITAWLDTGAAPSGVDLYSVVTWTDRSKPNYPPSAWLTDAGWPVPVLLDDAAFDAADAYGLSATPMWVFIGSDGKVAGRVSAELTGQQLGGYLRALR